MVVDKENRGGTAGVARAFYPFVDNTTSDSDEGATWRQGAHAPSRYATRRA